MTKIIGNILTTALAAGAGYLLKHGVITQAGQTELLAVGGIGLAWLLNHLHLTAQQPATSSTSSAARPPGSVDSRLMLLALLPAALLASGCAYMHSKTESTVTRTPWAGTNFITVTKQRTSARAYTLFDANASLTKFRNQSSTSSTNSFSPGTSVQGLSESASSTNAAAALNAISSLATAAAAVLK